MADRAAAPASSVTPPVPYTRLQQMASDACTAALRSATSYDHGQTESWNTTIINNILQSLISEASSPPSNAPAYKFAVNSTIIQHQASPSSMTSTSTNTGTSAPSGVAGAAEADARDDTYPTAGATSDERALGGIKSSAGRRGMHSATGAYWNTERDGMWNYKYEGGEGRGLDVVVSILWIGI